MSPERWEQIKEVLQAALVLKPEERSLYLDRACSTDHPLRQEVESLLSESDQVRSSFLQSPPIGRSTLTRGTSLGPYEIVSLIGAGGMGEVYRARDLRLRRDVAIKVLPSFVSSDKQRLRRFEQEAQAAAALNHPNILAVHQMGTYEGAPYLVSELLEGETLREEIRRGPLPARRAVDQAVQIARGLAAAHGQGIAHRDLKPENLFLTKDGRVKILDFGLAKLTEAPLSPEHSARTVATETAPGVVMGTVGYMSPEQVRGEATDYRTDIFALGAILYEMLSSKRAFQRPTSAETMTAILNEDPPALSQLLPNVPPALQRVVQRCLEKNPEQRFQSASDLAFAMEALSDSGVTPLPRVEMLTPTMGKWRTLLLAAAAAMFVAGVLWWQMAPAVPRVEGVRQLTDDAEPKLFTAGGNLVTDGLRVYFSEGQVINTKIVQVSVTGGESALVPMRFKLARLDDLAPDASALLVSPLDAPKKWIQPLPGGEPRSLGFDYDESGRFLPDGGVVFTSGRNVYVANLDGSSRRKLATAPGHPVGLAVSPDGKRVRFTLLGDGFLYSIWEVNTDGTGLHQVPMRGLPQAPGEIGGSWTRDGKYYLFQSEREGRWDLWALPEANRLRHHSGAPLQLTNGPLSYEGPVGSRDGKQIFAVGSKKRGELMRYDTKSRQFVSYLSGISAVESRVSRDGKWVIYVSYPDHTLWRSRNDGSERVQLTFPPMMVFYPEISPDGTKVAFTGMTTTLGPGTYLLSMEGGQPERIFEIGHAPTWSPDGSSLAFDTIIPGRYPFDESPWIGIQMLNLLTKKASVIPTPEASFGPWWPRSDKLLAAATVSSSSAFHVFDLTTQRWSQLGGGFDVLNWVPSPDGKYLYLLTSDPQSPKVRRLRASDFEVETVADLAGVRLIVDDSLGASSGAWIGVAADGSPTVTRDVGSDEIYALDVK